MTFWSWYRHARSFNKSVRFSIRYARTMVSG